MQSFLRKTTLAIMFASLSCHSYSDVVTWVGPTNGDWGQDTNWSSSIPNADDDVGIYEPVAVNLNSGRQVRSLNTGAASILNIASGGNLTIFEEYSSLLQGVLNVEGELTGFLEQSGLTNNYGTINTNYFSNQGILNNFGLITGNIGDSAVFNNYGDVVGTWLDSAGEFFNSGSLSISDSFFGYPSGNIENVGQIDAKLILAPRIINAGSILSSHIEVDQFENSGFVETELFDVDFQLQNGGSIATDYLYFANVDLENSGYLSSSIATEGGVSNLVNSGELELGGQGYLSVGSFENSGTFRSNEHRLDFGHVLNTGIIEIKSESKNPFAGELSGNILNQGLIINNGILETNLDTIDGDIQNFGAIRRNGLELTLSGNVIGAGDYDQNDVTFSGSFSVGEGTVEAMGVSFTDNASLTMQLLTGSHSKIWGSTVNLNGILSIELGNFFSGTLGDTYDLISASDLIGDFTSLSFTPWQLGLGFVANKVFQQGRWIYQLEVVEVPVPSPSNRFAYFLIFLYFNWQTFHRR